MRAILEFDMDEPCEVERMLRAIRSEDFASVIMKMDRWLRQETKHAEDSPRRAALLEARDVLSGMIPDSLWEIML